MKKWRQFQIFLLLCATPVWSCMICHFNIHPRLLNFQLKTKPPHSTKKTLNPDIFVLKRSAGIKKNIIWSFTTLWRIIPFPRYVNVPCWKSHMVFFALWCFFSSFGKVVRQLEPEYHDTASYFLCFKKSSNALPKSTVTRSLGSFLRMMKGHPLSTKVLRQVSSARAHGR